MNFDLTFFFVKVRRVISDLPVCLSPLNKPYLLRKLSSSSVLWKTFLDLNLPHMTLDKRHNYWGRHLLNVLGLWEKSFCLGFMRERNTLVYVNKQGRLCSATHSFFLFYSLCCKCLYTGSSTWLVKELFFCELLPFPVIQTRHPSSGNLMIIIQSPFHF